MNDSSATYHGDMKTSKERCGEFTVCFFSCYTYFISTMKELMSFLGYSYVG